MDLIAATADTGRVGPLGLAASLVLVAVVVAISRWRHLDLGRDVVVACGLALIQLLLVGAGPYRGRLALSVLCALMAAVLWGANLSVIYPTLFLFRPLSFDPAFEAALCRYLAAQAKDATG